MDLATRIVETHISTLFFVGDRVYKVKKPLKNGFLDFTQVTARREACRREVDLNRRLASDVYLGVADVTMDGEELEHMVVMARLPEDRRLSTRLDLATIDDDLRHIAHLIAAFHSTTAHSAEIDAASGADAVTRLWEAGIDQVGAFAGTVLDAGEVGHAAHLARGYLRGRRPLLDSRVSDGHACDGHGDLQAEDIFVLEDGPRVLDCLEFDDLLRWGDSLSDVAFLAMDLGRLQRPDLGARFLELYRELSGDAWPSSLAHVHIAYRAHVRAKVACLRHQQGDPGAADEARALLRQAIDHLDAGRVRLVMVGGAPGTGKSALSRELAERIGAVLVSSDLVRDDLFPRSTPGRDSLGEGRYTPERVNAVYEEMTRRAELVVSHGESVVLDASWLDPEHRDMALDLADRTSTVLTELRCDCPPELADQRIRNRAAAGADASEITPEIAHELIDRVARWSEAAVIDTRAPLGEAVGLAEAITTRPDPMGRC